MTKISAFFIGDPSPYLDWVVQMGSTSMVVFAHDSRATLQLCKQAVPHVIYRADPGTDFREISPIAFYQSLPLDKLAGLGLIWMGPNEPYVGSADDCKRLSDWYCEFKRLMGSERVIAYSFSTGNPTNLAWIPYLWPGFAACEYFGLHEYYASYAGFAMMRKHAEIYATLPAQYRKPVIINEWGYDENGDPMTGGWKAHVSIDRYIDILRSGLGLLEDYVLGATIFAIGGGWPSFQIWDIKDRLLALAREGQPIPPPIAPPPDLNQPPHIEYFKAEPSTIYRGDWTALEWGAVTHAERADIDHNIGGVGTPGTKDVKPIETTTYVMTATRGNLKTTAEATVTVNTVPTNDEIDPRLAPMGIHVGRTPGAKWVVRGLRYQDELEAGGNHNIYFKVVDASGQPVGGVLCYVDFPQDPNDPHPLWSCMTSEQGVCSFGMYASFDPNRKDGPYYAWVEDTKKSDITWGMGLPLKRHVNYILTYGPPMPVEPVPASLEDTVRQAARKLTWMPLNSAAALYLFGEQQKLGYPQTDEFPFTFEGVEYVGQVWNLGIVYVKRGDWQNCHWTKK